MRRVTHKLSERVYTRACTCALVGVSFVSDKMVLLIHLFTSVTFLIYIYHIAHSYLILHTHERANKQSAANCVCACCVYTFGCVHARASWMFVFVLAKNSGIKIDFNHFFFWIPISFHHTTKQWDQSRFSGAKRTCYTRLRLDG